jgi:hypothetical protein
VFIFVNAPTHSRYNTTAPAVTPSLMLYSFRTSTAGRATKDRALYETVSRDGKQVPRTWGVEAKKYRNARESGRDEVQDGNYASDDKT